MLHKFLLDNRAAILALCVEKTLSGEGHKASSAKLAGGLPIGFLAHELRNALGTIASAHRLMQRGVVGFQGSTSQVMAEAIKRMQGIIDRSLAEVRLQGEPKIENRRFRLIDIIGEVETTAALDLNERSITILMEVSPELVLEGDRHLLLSAISNLVQNAIKFTKPNTTVTLRARAVDDRILVEVEDECGGLPEGKIEELFQPFSQKNSDRSGVGLGLSISRRAIVLNKGSLSATDLPGKGCIFTINLPRAPILQGQLEGISRTIN